MDERRCRYCQKSFQPSKSQPRQKVCGAPDCQRRRRTDYHKAKFATDPVYREVCRDSPRKWRARNPGYWQWHRETHPAAVEHNRQQQRVRDRKRRLRHLANNTSALDLKQSAAQIWLVGRGAAQLANNNSAAAQIWVIEALPPNPLPVVASCQQQRPGSAATPGA
jgi:hypothetical protein